MAEQAFPFEGLPQARDAHFYPEDPEGPPPSEDRGEIARLQKSVVVSLPRLVRANRQPLVVVEPEVKQQLHKIVRHDQIAGALALYYGKVESPYNVPEQIIDGFSGRVSQLMRLYNDKMYPNRATRTALFLDDEITVLRSTLVKSDEWARRPFSWLLEGKNKTERSSLVQARDGMLRQLAMVASHEPEYTDR